MDQQYEWASSNIKISYPFEGVQPDNIKELFADAVIVDGEQVLEQVMLRGLSSDGITGTINIAYADSYSTFFNNTPTFEKYSYGAWDVLRFHDDADNKSVTLLLHDVSYPLSVTGDRIFVTRCVEPGAARVNKLTVYDENDIPHELTGDIEFSEGYNMSLDYGTEEEVIGDRTGQLITLSAIPGAGLGLVPNDCEGDGYIRTINGVGPDEFGRFTLSPAGCYRIWRPLDVLGIQPLPNTLQIANDCLPCCECDDYGKTYSAMNRLYNIGRDNGKMLAGLGGASNALNDNIRQQRNLRAKRRFHVLMRPSPGKVLGVMLEYLNNPPNVYNLGSEPYDIRFTFTSPLTGGKFLEESVYIYNQRYEEWRKIELCQAFPNISACGGSQAYPQFYAGPSVYDEILGTQYAILFFELYFPDASHGTVVNATVESMNDKWLYDQSDDHHIQVNVELIDTLEDESV